MIKASALRKGNYLKGVDIVEVESINRNNTVCIKDNTSTFHVEGERPCFIPIPLTVEWLLKFGFKDIDFGCQLRKEDCILYFDTFLNCWIGDSDLVHGIDYVHQLQNLYFALTGEELTIKETV